MTEDATLDPAGPGEASTGLEPQYDPAALGLQLPDDNEAAVEVLLEALATAKGAADAYLDDLRRVAAEFENFRKRVVREREETVARSSQRVIAALLPVLDSFSQAFAQEAQTPAEESLLAGVRSTYHQLMDVLFKEGLELIPTVAEAFDPEVHEAVAGGGDGDLVVVDELRTGYTLGGRVLRPAMVVVAPSPAEGSPGSEGG